MCERIRDVWVENCEGTSGVVKLGNNGGKRDGGSCLSPMEMEYNCDVLCGSFKVSNHESVSVG